MTDDDVEQYSDESRERLRVSATALMAALERHTAALLELDGGSSALPTLFALNDEVREAAAVWDDAVFDHTGTFPVGVEHADDDLDVGAGGDDDAVAAGPPLAVSVVSRWDLDLTDVAALVRAGRAAHRRMDPSESDLDAAAVIGDDAVGPALYALVHEHGEPWFELPGVGVVTGHRAYLRRDADEPTLETMALDHDRPPAAPDGPVLFSETW